jgi:hypothetical protein
MDETKDLVTLHDVLDAQWPSSAFESPTFDQDVSIAVDDEIGASSISPAGRDIVLASKSGLRIIDLDNPWSLGYGQQPSTCSRTRTVFMQRRSRHQPF